MIEIRVKQGLAALAGAEVYSASVSVNGSPVESRGVRLAWDVSEWVWVGEMLAAWARIAEEKGLALVWTYER